MAQITILLTPTEKRALERMAKANCRPTREQARWLVKSQVSQYLEEKHDPNATASHETSHPAYH